MTKSCLVWFANGTDISNTSHSGLTTGSFWSSAAASECFSPESAECFSISSLLPFVSASCSLKGKKNSLEESEGKTVGVQDLTCLEFQWLFLVWQGAHLNCPGVSVWCDGVWSSFANALSQGWAAVTVRGGHLRGLPQVLKHSELLQGGRALSISCSPTQRRRRGWRRCFLWRGLKSWMRMNPLGV